MPSAAAQKSRRVEQCCYREDGRRCRRSATGNTPVPLCNPHKIAVAEQTRKQSEPASVGAGVTELFDRVMSGRKVNRKVVAEAVGDIAQWWEQFQAQQAQRAQQEPPIGPHNARWYDPIVNEAKKRTQQRPPEDPRVAELKQKRSRARQVLGFGQQDELTEEMLNARRRELARKFHPDRGGSVTKMQEINDAVDVLLAELVA